MGRNLDAKCRQCRREAKKLFLKGTRCDTPKCPMDEKHRPNKAKVPGQHGDKRQRLTDYAVHMREKQRAKRIYGLLERQFRQFFDHALRMPGNTGENLVVLLERRLDNVVYRLGFARSHSEARQVVGHGHIALNGERTNLPSYLVKVGDVIRPVARDASKKLLSDNLKIINKEHIPSWLRLSEEPLEGTIVQIPNRQDITVDINEQLIVELCSK